MISKKLQSQVFILLIATKPSTHLSPITLYLKQEKAGGSGEGVEKKNRKDFSISGNSQIGHECSEEEGGGWGGGDNRKCQANLDIN